MSSSPGHRRSSLPPSRFQPGQEKEAAAYVAQPSRFDEFRILAYRRAVLGVYLSVPVGVLFYFVGQLQDDGVGLSLAAGLVFGLGLAIIAGIHAVKAGYFILDPVMGAMISGGEKTPFSDIHHPEVTVRGREIMSTQWHPMTTGEVGIKYETKRAFSGQPIVLVGAGFSTRRLEKIANLMKEMADEWREKEAVRRWLKAQQSRESWEEQKRDGAAAGIDLKDLGKLLDG